MSGGTRSRSLNDTWRVHQRDLNSDVVATVCTTFIYDGHDGRYVCVPGCDGSIHHQLKKIELNVGNSDEFLLRMKGRDEHEHLPELDADIDLSLAQVMSHVLTLACALKHHELAMYETFFHSGAIHFNLILFGAICDNSSPSWDHARYPLLQQLREIILPRGEMNVDLQSDCEADISSFLDNIPPRVLPEHGPVQGLLCPLLPFQARALTWMLKRERHPETSSPKLDVLFEEINSAGSNLYVNKYTGRITTVRFVDKTESIRGGMLCQAMGLGKTVEQIALILTNPCSQEWLDGGEFERRAATLVVSPQALLGQWQQEVARHAPCLRVGIVFSQSDFHLLDDCRLDVVLTSYETVRQQHVYQTANESRRTSRHGRTRLHPTPFLQNEWWRVVLDEAQRITGESGVTKAVQCLKANLRWVVSGTPICRRLQDLSGLLRFLNHNLGDLFFFKKLRQDGECLRDVLSIVMYRHGKQCVAQELAIPPLTVETVHIQLTDIEHIKYSKLVRKCNAIKNLAGLKESTRIARLCRMLLLLRKICCCPFLVDGRKGDTMQASEALPILEIKTRICREAELEVDLAKRVTVKCTTLLATAAAITDQDYERAEQCIKSALSVAEDAVLTGDIDRDKRSGTRLDDAKTKSGRAVLMECLGRVDEARTMLLECHDAVEQHLSAQLAKLQESGDVSEPLEGGAESSLEAMFQVCSTRFTLAIFKLMMGTLSEKAVADLRALDASVSAYLASFDNEIATAVGETPQVLASLRGRLEVELQVSLHRRTLFRDLIALRVSILDCLADLALLSMIDVGEYSAKDRDACKQLLNLLPVDRDRTEIGFVADAGSDEDEVQDEDNFRRTALGENRTGFVLDAETIDYLVLQGSIMTGLLRTLEKLHLDVGTGVAETLTSRVSMISIAVGKEPAAISPRCSSWVAAMFALLRTWLYVRQMITNSDENDGVAGQCWERCFVIREELRNLYRRSFDQLEQFFEDVRAGKQTGAIPADVRRAEIELERSEQELAARQREQRYISQKFAAAGGMPQDESRIHSDDDVCPICRARLQTPIVTPCGHIFCSSCLSSYMISGHGHCPLRCRNLFAIKDCLLIEESDSEQRRKRFKGEMPPTDEIQSEYGAKISDLVRRLLAMRSESDSAPKSLIFSQWIDLLNVCRMALEEHGIRCVQLKGDSRQKANCIDQFLNSPTMTVFLIPMAQGASGLTMVAAQYAFIMEPCLNPSLEDQAINRIHRIGQRHTTKVIKYIAVGTVEEPIAEIQERQRATGHQAQKAYTPEVFDESILNDIFR